MEAAELKILCYGQFQQIQVSGLCRLDHFVQQKAVIRIVNFLEIGVIVDQEIFQLSTEADLVIGILEIQVLGLCFFQIERIFIPAVVRKVCVLEDHFRRFILCVSANAQLADYVIDMDISVGFIEKVTEVPAYDDLIGHCIDIHLIRKLISYGTLDHTVLKELAHGTIGIPDQIILEAKFDLRFILQGFPPQVETVGKIIGYRGYLRGIIRSDQIVQRECIGDVRLVLKENVFLLAKARVMRNDIRRAYLGIWAVSTDGIDTSEVIGLPYKESHVLPFIERPIGLLTIQPHGITGRRFIG